MSNVVPLTLVEVGAGRKLQPSRVLAGARAANLTEVVVFGTTPKGDMYVASSEGPGDAMWLIEAAKLYLLRGARPET